MQSDMTLILEESLFSDVINLTEHRFTITRSITAEHVVGVGASEPLLKGAMGDHKYGKSFLILLNTTDTYTDGNYVFSTAVAQSSNLRKIIIISTSRGGARSDVESTRGNYNVVFQ